MAQITHLMQAKAAFDAACLDIAWAPCPWDDEPAADRIQEVLEEAERRCIRVLLEEEEEETPAMMMIQQQEQEQEVESRSIGDWLTSVKDVAADMRALAREELLGGGRMGRGKLIARMKLPCLAPEIKTTEADILEKIRGKLEALMEKYEGFRYTKGLPLASCCTEQPSCVGQQSIITDVPLGRERDDDKQRIIGIITQQAAQSRETETDQPVILPIFGPAGIGKTTLVKSIFNDPELFQDYAKAWVDTPEGEDLKKIYTSIISSSQALLGGSESPPPWTDDDYSVNAITNQLAELFRSGNKKLLLVLDDLWVEGEVFIMDDGDFSRMDALKSLLCGIGRNLVVIVTTPIKSIAGYITSNVIKPYQLHPLSHDTCWEIMKRTSGFEARNDEEAEAAERIGREIASKCCGLPLAAKALGRTLRFVDNPQHWSAAAGDYSDDSPQLPLGLHTLAVLSHLKQAYHVPDWHWLCFATCAFFFSKGRRVSRYDLHGLWLALNICYSFNASYSYLLGRSLLRENSASNASTVLKDALLVSTDDMMYDVARSVLGDRLIVVDGRNGGATVSPAVKRSSNAYLAVISNWDANQQLDLSSILPAGILALRFEDCPAKMEFSDGAFVFSSADHLLVLDLSGCSLKKLPESIGQLKRLRYLNAPGIQDRVLPVCLTRLHRLRFLSLRRSPLLSDLTEAFGRLDMVRHLDLSGCLGLKALPDSFKRLRNLEHLDLSGCSELKALPDSFMLLYRLEHLDLSGWSCVGGITEALQRFEYLRYLNLSHRCGYFSVEDWFHLKDLDKVLPKHKELWFLGLSSCLNPLCYTSTPDKSKDYVDCCIKDLVELRHLDLSHNKFLVQLPESMGNLKELCSLDLSGCFRLERLPESIGELKELCTLDLSGCFRLERLPESIGELKELCTLDLSGCFRLERLPESIGELKELCKLNLSGCIGLWSLPERIGELKRLETLDLSGCPWFDPLSENVQQKLAKLRSQSSLTIITNGKAISSSGGAKTL